MITERIAELKADADMLVSAESERDLLNYTQSNMLPRPIVTLLDNGNFRALWCNGDEQVGLQFMGNRVVQYVTRHGNRWQSGRAHLNV